MLRIETYRTPTYKSTTLGPKQTAVALSVSTRLGPKQTADTLFQWNRKFE